MVYRHGCRSKGQRKGPNMHRFDQPEPERMQGETHTAGCRPNSGSTGRCQDLFKVIRQLRLLANPASPRICPTHNFHHSIWTLLIQLAAFWNHMSFRALSTSHDRDPEWHSWSSVLGRRCVSPWVHTGGT